MSTNERDDPPRDAWLVEALRHAPDASAAPPNALSEAILREARTAVAAADVGRRVSSSAGHPARSGLAAFWSWLARPPVAAGFASVMVATLAGVMWWDRPLEETVSRPPAVDSSSPAANGNPRAAAQVQGPPEASASAGPTSAAGPKAAAKMPAPSGNAPRAVESAPPPIPRPPETPAPFEDLRAERRPAPEPAEAGKNRTRSQRAPEAPAAEPAPPAPAPAAATTAAPPIDTVQPLAVPQRLQQSEPVAPTRVDEASATPASDVAAAARDEAKSTAAEALARGRAGASGKLAPGADRATSSATLRREDARPAPSRPAAFAALLASVTTEPGRWSWQRGGPVQPMSVALQRWLTRLDAATAARWQDVPNERGAAAADGILRLYKDDERVATIEFRPAAVDFAPASRATLDPAEIAALKQALDRATP